MAENSDVIGPRGRYHSQGGWFFERADDGYVVITRRLPIHDDFRGDLDGWPVEYVKLDANTWASAVASVSKRGEDAETFRQAQELHNAGGVTDVALARHHVECEKAGEKMAAVLRQVAELRYYSDIHGEVEEAIAAWDAHQWPNDKSEG